MAKDRIVPGLPSESSRSSRERMPYIIHQTCHPLVVWDELCRFRDTTYISLRPVFPLYVAVVSKAWDVEESLPKSRWLISGHALRRLGRYARSFGIQGTSINV